MSDYIIGGWSQNPADTAPSSFSYTMYGMITNLAGLTSGTPASPGWSPARTAAPKGGGKILWTYGGGGCSPAGMPETDGQIRAIEDATTGKNWDGVDFDDECNMDVSRIIKTMQALHPKETSYTFLAGWDYNNPTASTHGQAINTAVQTIARSNAARRQILMCYAAKMWSMADIKANVGPAIQRTMDNGVPPDQVILALTPAGLTDENLAYFLDQVTAKKIGGLFIWNFPALKSADLAVIEKALNIGTA